MLVLPRKPFAFELFFCFTSKVTTNACFSMKNYKQCMHVLIAEIYFVRKSTVGYSSQLTTVIDFIDVYIYISTHYAL